MKKSIVRMHLAQTLTRAENPDVCIHIQTALDACDNENPPSESTGGVPLDRIEIAETELEEWLVYHAQTGVPEAILTGILRDYADRIDELGHVPRSWAPADGYRIVSSLQTRGADADAEANQRGENE